MQIPLLRLENEQFKQLATLLGNASRLTIEHSSGPFRAWMKTMDPKYDDYVPADAADFAGYRRVYIESPEGVTVNGTVSEADRTAVAEFRNGDFLSSSDEWVKITNCDTGNWLRLPVDKAYKVSITVSRNCDLGLRLGEYSVDEGKIVKTVTGDKKYNWKSLNLKKGGKAVLTVPEVKARDGKYELGSDVYYYVKVTQPKANPIKVTAKKKAAVVKHTALEKAAVTVPAGKLMTVSGAKGTVTYRKLKVNKLGGRFSVDSKTGAVTIKKNTKKGAYKIRIRVRASGSGSYAAGSRTVTCRITVK